MIGWVHQESQRALEGIVHLVGIECERKSWSKQADDWRDAVAGCGDIEVAIADRIDESRGEADFLASLPQCGAQRAVVAGVDPPAREGDLAGMIAQGRRSPRQENGRLAW